MTAHFPEISQCFRIAGMSIEIEFCLIYGEADLIDMVHKLSAVHITAGGLVHCAVVHAVHVVHLRLPPFPRNGLSSLLKSVPHSSALHGS